MCQWATEWALSSQGRSLGSQFPSAPPRTPSTHSHRWNLIHEVELNFACKSFWLQTLGLTVTTIYCHYWNNMGWPRIKINEKRRWERGETQEELTKFFWKRQIPFPCEACGWCFLPHTQNVTVNGSREIFFPTLHVCPSIRVIVASPGTSCCR